MAAPTVPRHLFGQVLARYVAVLAPVGCSRERARPAPRRSSERDVSSRSTDHEDTYRVAKRQGYQLARESVATERSGLVGCL